MLDIASLSLNQICDFTYHTFFAVVVFDKTLKTRSEILMKMYFSDSQY